MKRTAISALFLIMINALSGANELKKDMFFSNEEAVNVLQGGIITRMYIKGDVVKENTHPVIPVPRTKYTDEDYTIYEMITDEKAFFPYKINDEKDLLRFYNIITACSKLKGMKYYSRRVGKVENLIIDSYRIDSKDNKKALSDKSYISVPDIEEGYFLQKDNRFGSLVFKTKLIKDGNSFVFINTCVNKIDKLGFKICDEGEYKFISYFIYDGEKSGFFYYTVNVSRIKSELLIKGNDLIPPLNPTTFSNRIRAATVHLAKMLGLNWDNKINPWDEDFLKQLRKSKKTKK